jgi:hypothetical protein
MTSVAQPGGKARSWRTPRRSSAAYPERGGLRRWRHGLTRQEARPYPSTHSPRSRYGQSAGSSGTGTCAGEPPRRRWPARMPGDDVVPRAQFNATRSISIDAAPKDVWPWIVQLGYRRAGFYTYDQVDNASEPSADRIIEEYQDLKIGDEIRMWHGSYGLSIAYVVDSFEAPSWILWVHRPHEGERPDSTWSWRLVTLPSGGTRLLLVLALQGSGPVSRSSTPSAIGAPEDPPARTGHRPRVAQPRRRRRPRR